MITLKQYWNTNKRWIKGNWKLEHIQDKCQGSVTVYICNVRDRIDMLLDKNYIERDASYFDVLNELAAFGRAN